MKHEKYSFGYDLLRIYARLVHRFIHRRITVNGLNNIPQKTPVIFTPNHQNALMDAMAVLLSSPHQPTWLARADLFKSKIVSKILFFLKMSPVYRIRDGKDNLEKNDAVFELSIRVLKNNKSLALFPEAKHTFRRQSAAHKKAVPRIAFMAEERENFELGIQIVPIGIYYDHYYKYNRELIVTYGKPVSLSNYKELYSKNPTAATIALRKEIYDNLIPLTIHIKSKTHYEDYETLRKIYRNSILKNLPPSVKLRREIEFIGTAETWEANHPGEADALFSEAAKYRESLAKLKVSDVSLAKSTSFAGTLWRVFLAGFTLPLFLYGWLNFFLGFYLPSRLIRSKIKDRVFWATAEYIAWIIFIPVFLLIQWGAVWIVSDSFLLSIAYLATLPIFGKLALNLNDFYSGIWQQIKILTKDKKFAALKALRENILNKIKNFSD
jgi:1-acyl-sn-glycerol-3-phosphate acyltransferase